jgi:hypothetical protein
MARQMPDLTLGIGYLIVSNMVRLLERVQRSPRETLDFPPDSRSGRVQVTSANAAPWLADYRARVAAYRQAIEERGPASVSGAYELSAAPGCGLEVQLPVLAWLARRQAETGPSGDLPPEGLLPEGARIDQEGGVLTLTVALRTRVGPREMLGHGVAVGRTLVATDLDEAEVFLAGQAQGGRIVLRPSVEYSRPLATASDESSDPARCEVTLTRERP